MVPLVRFDGEQPVGMLNVKFAEERALSSFHQQVRSVVETGVFASEVVLGYVVVYGRPMGLG